MSETNKQKNRIFINSFHNEVYERVPWYLCLWYSLIWLFAVPLLLILDNIKHLKQVSMSHPAQRAFVKEMRRKYLGHFIGGNTIDCGSRDINGNNRRYFRRNLFNWVGMNTYIGIDVEYGENVHVVGAVHEVLPIIASYPTKYLPKGRVDGPTWPPDIVISTEMLEHDQHWRESLLAMYQVLRPGGLLLITAAGIGRAEHGTKMCEPSASPGTLDYYHNISNDMFRSILPTQLFSEFTMRQVDGDFQFAGIKKKEDVHSRLGGI